MVGFHDATRLATLHNSAMPGPLTPRHKGTVYGDDDISIFSHLLSIYLSIYLYLSIYRCLWRWAPSLVFTPRNQGGRWRRADAELKREDGMYRGRWP